MSNCTHGNIKLVGGDTEREGRVEVCINGLWGSVCSSGWNLQEANVICRYVGYPTQGWLYMY